MADRQPLTTIANPAPAKPVGCLCHLHDAPKACLTCTCPDCGRTGRFGVGMIHRPLCGKDGSESAMRCYDCGTAHPDWAADLLYRMWVDDYEWTADEAARMVAWTQAEHAGCFQ